MFIIDPIYSIVAVAIAAGVYWYIAWKNVAVDWGSAFQAHQVRCNVM